MRLIINIRKIQSRLYFNHIFKVLIFLFKLVKMYDGIVFYFLTFDISIFSSIFEKSMAVLYLQTLL